MEDQFRREGVCVGGREKPNEMVCLFCEEERVIIVTEKDGRRS